MMHPRRPTYPLTFALLLATSCELPGSTRGDGLVPGAEIAPARTAKTAALGERPAAATPALEVRFRGAERIDVATVDRVSAAFGRNEHGDQLIISTVTLQVHESLRGEARTVVSFKLEGGTVGDLTLEVSDLPSLRPGDHGVFALRRAPGGSWVPSGRSLGILRTAPGADLGQLRRAEEVSR